MQISLHDVEGQMLRVGIRRGDEARAPLLMFNGIGANLELLNPFAAALDKSIEAVATRLCGAFPGAKKPAATAREMRPAFSQA